MINVARLLMHRARRGNLNVTVVESPDAAQESELAAMALEQKIQHLADELTCAQQKLRTLRGSIAEPESRNVRAMPYKPSALAYRILVGFCVRNTSELSESAILEMFSDDQVAVLAALAEICDHGLM